MLGFRPRNQDFRRNAKRQAVELCLSDYVLDGLAAKAAFEELTKSSGLIVGEIVICMSEEPRLVLLQNMQQQSLGVLTGAVRMRPVR